MKIIFFGTSGFAIPSLRMLAEHKHAPVAIITAPDKPKGRGKRLTFTPVKQFVIEKIDKPGLSIWQLEKLDAVAIEHIVTLQPNLGIIAAYGKIIPKELIDIFPHGLLNIHPSILPKYRGPSPIQTTILNGDAETGVTIIQIDEQLDHGPIVAQRGYVIPTDITYPALHNALAELGAQLLIETLPKWMVGEITPTSQDDAKATYTKLLKKEDGEIDWSKSAEEIERMVRAYNPWPGSYTEVISEKLKVKSILKIKKVDVLKLNPVRNAVSNGVNQEQAPFPSPRIPGTFFKTTDGFPAVICGTDALKFLMVQPEGKKDMLGDAFAHGYMSL